ncbi:pentapeptide repeat-containing protein [Marivita sp. S6314]|uniref:pentapeptide repeat-containing protein n=1 Tax=Marivita sp. S6314 TaxID=2926406 RepID=UPI001FF6609C|nr:pentapeptide repeat-containing protein [Marivita sp. S6314]MCK0150132.1 pentapeptide repeat-containing protein [Marivita sp. S6314]
MTPDALIAELQKPWHHGEHFDGRAAVIDGPLVLDGMVLRGFDLSGAAFKGNVSARGTTFLGLAWLMNATIDGTLDLTGARFMIDCRAEGLTADTLCLDEVQVRGVLDLERVRAQRISLLNALIMANLTLENAQIASETNLSNSEFLGGFWADGAQLGTVTTNGCDLHGRRSNWDALQA